MRKRQTCPTAVDSGALMTQPEIRVKPETAENGGFCGVSVGCALARPSAQEKGRPDGAAFPIIA